MIKNLAKLLFTIAGFAVVAAFAMSIFTGGNALGMDSIMGPLSFGWKGYVGNHTAYVSLMTLAGVSLGLGILTSAIHDGDPADAPAIVGTDTIPAAAPVDGASWWPILGALSFVLLALGLAVGPVLFVIGGFLLGIVIVEWTVRAWSERASGDPELNRSLRQTLLVAFEYPAFGVLTLFAVAAAMWKIMTALPTAGAIAIFSLIPALILGFGAYLTSRPRVSRSVVAGIIAVAAVALIAGAVVAAIVGENDHGALDSHTAPAAAVIEAGL